MFFVFLVEKVGKLLFVGICYVEGSFEIGKVKGGEIVFVEGFVE